jgi:hypothetical protein
LKLNQKGQPSKKQKTCELSKLSNKKRNNANPNEEGENEGPVEVPVPVETKLTIPANNTIWPDAKRQGRG